MGSRRSLASEHPIRLKRQDYKKLRRLVLKRDRWRCVDCEKRNKIRCVHVTARRDGGSDVESNLITLCQRCQSERDKLRPIRTKSVPIPAPAKVLPEAEINVFSAPNLAASSQLEIGTLPFEVLPGGDWFSNLLRRFEDFNSQRKQSSIDRYQPLRLQLMKTLEPTKVYVGTEGWGGYAVFEFDAPEPVFLECPYKGNATYVVGGNWRDSIKLSKGRLLKHKNARRIVHSESWHNKIVYEVSTLRRRHKEDCDQAAKRKLRPRGTVWYDPS